MRSMTGYGRGVAERAGHRVVVEMRSVNHRYLDLKVRGSAVGPAALDRISKQIKARLSRGSVVLTVRATSSVPATSVRVDVAAARRILGELAKLDELGAHGSVSTEFLCSQPGVLVQTDEVEIDDSQLEACADEAATLCLDALVGMREAEGQSLLRDISGRLDHLVELAAQISEHAVDAPAEAQKRLRERLGRLLKNVGVELDPDRVAQEVAMVADRLDVSEELVRVQSHVDQARSLLADPSESVGRRLDFLVQELVREFNTITSKSQSAAIARLVVDAKAELEKVREQVQNVE